MSRRGVYGDDAPPGDSFHNPTPERKAVVTAWWANEDYHRQATVKDESISIDLHPGWNGGRQLVIVDIDDTALRDAIENAPALNACPVVTGKKGAKVLAFLDPVGGRPESPIVQYARPDDPDRPALEIFTGSKHALVYGEHPDSTPEHRVLFTVSRGFGEPIPVLSWPEVQVALAPVVREHGLVLKESGGDREPAEPVPALSRPQSGRTITDRLGLSIASVCTVSDGVRCGDEIRGSHPVHGSTSGQNFTINAHTNEWHCFRCGTGGGPLEWLAVEAEIVDCSEVRRGCLAGHWQEVFEVLRAKGYEVDSLPSPSGVPDPDMTPEVEAEALEILETGDPVAYLLEVFHTEHVRDDTIAKCCYVSAASRVVENSRGLHVLTIGPSGKGKSSSYDTVLKEMPEHSQIAGSLSDKALFYHDIPEGCVLVLDDKGMSEQLQEAFRSATSDIRKPTTLRTVGTRREPITVTLPARCVWWMASADDMADDQFHNRCLQPWCDDSEAADREFFDRLLQRTARGDVGEDPRFRVCRAMWSAIGAEVLAVWIPYAEAIRFGDMRNRRNGVIFLDMIACFARIRYLQRPRDEQGRIVAVLDDFQDALDLYHELTGDSGSQVNQLTPDEARLLRLIEAMRRESFNLNDLVAVSGLPLQRVRRILHGRPDRTSGGLLDKCPALTYQDVNVSTEEEHGLRRGHREKRYYVDAVLSRRWGGTGAITLDGDAARGVFTLFSQSFPSVFPPWEKTLAPISSRVFPERRENEREEREERESLPTTGEHTAPFYSPPSVCVPAGKMGKDSHLKNGSPYNGAEIRNMVHKMSEESFPKAGKDPGKHMGKDSPSQKRDGVNTPLPGSIDLDDLVPARPHTRRCQVCDQRTATLKSKDGHVWICHECQAHLLRARAREMGVRP